MTISPISPASLKRVKNLVIGNPSAKLQLAQDEPFVQRLIDCLSDQPSDNDVRIEASHVISSLAYGSAGVLAALLSSAAPHRLLCALAQLQPADPPVLRSAYARALRAVTAALADTVGPSQWGLRGEHTGTPMRAEATAALGYLFHIDELDIYLPLLADVSAGPLTSISIAQLLAAAVRTPEHRRAVCEWLPPADRLKEVKTRRGWEKMPSTGANAPTREGGWVARHLTALLRSRDMKLQEAALSALAALAKENHSVASVLARPSPDRDIPSTLSSVLSFSKSRSTDVQLAACLCATHILRAASSASHPSPADDSSARTVMNIVNRMLMTPSTDSSQHRTKACFILYYLVTDDASLCRTAYERGSLEKLAHLVESVMPPENTMAWDDDEPESISCLREAALTAIAAISLFDNDIRRAVTDDLHLLPTIHASLSHRHVGIRYAACQCVRALSRAVVVLRTNIVDNGIGMTVFGIFKKDDEDRRVLHAALAAVCNIVNESSPLRSIYIDKGLVPRLVQVLQADDATLRLSALWAAKNLLWKTSLETKRDVMLCLGWQQLASLLADADARMQEQAFSVVRNLAENEPGIDMVFRELGTETLLGLLAGALLSPDEDVVLQAAYVLANLANGATAHTHAILTHRELLAALHACLGGPRPDVRRPAVACVLELARAHPAHRPALVDAGCAAALRHICDWGAGAGGTAGAGAGAGGGVGARPAVEDRDVVVQARVALEWLERGDM